MITLNGQPLPVTLFPDRTSQVWKLPEEILTRTNYAHVVWKFESEGEFLHVAQLKDLLDARGIAATLRLTYLPYGRQDKALSNNATFALTTFARLLNSLRFYEVVIHDPHSSMALHLINNSRPQYPKAQIKQVLADCEIDMVCYPDAGALEKYSNTYELDRPVIHGEKVRDQSTGNILSYQLVGDPKDRNVLIVDDICDGGMTFKLLARDLLAKGARSVVLFVTHGIFSKGTRTLFETGIKRVFTADGEVGPRTWSQQL